ncbi:hypothetical protein N9928_00910 [bacterium]|nr:hypothetical protein [bacterium]
MPNTYHGTALAAMALAATVSSHTNAQKLEEVVVTATKRAESLQDVPISMLAKSGESIKDMGVARAEEFTADMPAVLIAQTPIGNYVFMRGGRHSRRKPGYGTICFNVPRWYIYGAPPVVARTIHGP